MQRLCKIVVFCSILLGAFIGNANQSVLIPNRTASHQYCFFIFGEDVTVRFEKMFRTGKIDVKPVGALKQTALHYAAVQNNADRVRQCIESGADVNARNVLGRTPLTALLRGSWQFDEDLYREARSIRYDNVVELLLNNGADVNSIDNYGKTAIDYAIIQGNLNVVKTLIQHGASLPTDRPGWKSVLAEDADFSPKMIQFLIDHGADVNAKRWRNSSKHFGFDEQFPLLIQIERGNWASVKYLLNRGANIYNRNQLKETVLLAAAQKGNLDLVKELVNRGADLNDVDIIGNTVLHFAARSKNPQLVQWLIEQGLDVNARNSFGLLPADAVTRFFDFTIDDFRIIYDEDNLGSRPENLDLWDKQTIKNASDTLYLLFDNGANVNDVSFMTLSELAYQNDDLKMFETLMAKGFNFKDKRSERIFSHIIDAVIIFKAVPFHKNSIEFILSRTNEIQKENKLLIFKSAVQSHQYEAADYFYRLWEEEIKEKLIVITKAEQEFNVDQSMFHDSLVIVDLRTDIPNLRYKIVGEITPNQMQWLIDRGYNPFLKDDVEQDAFYYAVQCNNLKLMKFLYKLNPNVDLPNQLPILINWKTVKWIIDASQNAKTTDDWKQKFLLGLSYTAALKEFKYAHSHGLDVTQKDVYDATVLDAVLKNNCRNSNERWRLIRWLVQLGCRIKEMPQYDNCSTYSILIPEVFGNPKELLDEDADDSTIEIGRLLNLKAFFRSPSMLAARGVVQTLYPTQWELLNAISKKKIRIKTDRHDITNALTNFQYFIERGIEDKRLPMDVNFSDMDYRTFLSEPFQRFIQILFDNDADLSSMSRQEQDVFLMMALTIGHLELTQELARRGADFLIQSNLTNLNFGVYECRNPELINWLKKQSFFVDYVNNHPVDFLESALSNDNFLLADIALECGAKVDDAMLNITVSGSPEALQWLIDHGGDVNAREKNIGYSLLLISAQTGRLEIVQTLIQNGADVNAVSNEGDSLACCAALSGNLNLVKYLAGLGVDFTVPIDKPGSRLEGYTPFHFSLYHNSPEMAIYLLSLGADIKAKPQNGDAPLHIAVKSDNLIMAKFLLDKGEDVNVTTPSGDTPLHLVLWTDNLDFVKLFVNRGADVNAKNKMGETPLDLAPESNCSKEIVDFLKKAAGNK